MEKYKNQSDNFILANNEELITRIEENIVHLNNIQSSKYVSPMIIRVENQFNDFAGL